MKPTGINIWNPERRFMVDASIDLKIRDLTMSAGQGTFFCQVSKLTRSLWGSQLASHAIN